VLAELERPDEKAAPKKIFIGYTPRTHFRPIHDDRRRFQLVVMHRRAGKTVGLCNQIIRAVFQNKRVFPVPRYAYVGPSFSQTKDLVWGYFKHYLRNVPGIKFKEDELQIILPTGALINLYGGATAWQRMRGLYMDGVVMDEYAMLHPRAWTSVIRPTLADYQGWAIISGTSNGDDHFHDMKKRAERQPERWGTHIVPVTDTNALDPAELAEMTADMTPEEYAREMLCDFSAPIVGAYYAAEINKARTTGRIRKLVYDPALPVYTFWDLGISDAMTIWVGQRVFNSWQWLHYIEGSGQGLLWYYDQLNQLPYPIAGDVYPHDIEARELGTGVKRIDVATNHGRNPHTVPRGRVEDGIQAVRDLIAVSYFDEVNCKEGINCLTNYQSQRSEKLGVQTKPLHNWASHGADAFRCAAMGRHLVTNTWERSSGPLRTGNKSRNSGGRLSGRSCGVM